MTMYDVGGNFWAWDTYGKVLEGEYLGANDFVFQNGDNGVEHGVLSDELGMVTFVGTYNLNRSLRFVPIGVKVRIEYVGEESTARRQSKVKLFRVQAEKIAAGNPRSRNFDVGGATVDGIEPETVASQQPLPEHYTVDGEPIYTK